MKKMALIPADMALRMQQQPYAPTAPAYNQLSLLDQQMKSVLETGNLSPEEKLQHYYNNLRRFGEIQNAEIRVPVPVRILPEQHEEPRNDNEDVEDGLPVRDSELLSRVSKHRRRGAKLLLDYIRKNPELKWNDANELIYRGQRIPNSNIYDLVRDFSEDAQKNQKSPRGWRELGEALSIQNIPRGAIGNKARQELFNTPETSLISQEEEDKDQFSVSKSKKRRAQGRKPDYGQGDGGIPWDTLPSSSSPSGNIYKVLGKLKTEPPPLPTRQSRRLRAGRRPINWETL